MYHQIGKNSLSIGLSLKKFRKQLNYFQKYFSSKKLNLTFDHGTKDHFYIVRNELEKRNLVGHFFILTMIQEEKILPAEDKQRKLETTLRRKLAKILCENLKILYKPLKAKNYLSRFKFYTLEERYLRYLRDKIIIRNDYEKFINKTFNQKYGKEKSFIEKYYLNWKEINILKENGHIIGSHSHYHIGDKNDFKKSIDIIRHRANLNVTEISYPNGNKKITDQELKQLKINKGFTTELKPKKNPYHQHRVDCNQLRIN